MPTNIAYDQLLNARELPARQQGLTPEDYIRLINAQRTAKSNIKIERKLHSLYGIDTQKALQPVEEEETSTLTDIFNILDYPAEKVRRHVLAPILGVDTTDMERVTGESLLESKGVEEGWKRTAEGLAIEILSDPLTYMTAGLGSLRYGSLAGKALTRGGKAAKAGRIGALTDTWYAKLAERARPHKEAGKDVMPLHEFQPERFPKPVIEISDKLRKRADKFDKLLQEYPAGDARNRFYETEFKTPKVQQLYKSWEKVKAIEQKSGATNLTRIPDDLGLRIEAEKMAGEELFNSMNQTEINRYFSKGGIKFAGQTIPYLSGDDLARYRNAISQVPAIAASLKYTEPVWRGVMKAFSTKVFKTPEQIANNEEMIAFVEKGKFDGLVEMYGKNKGAFDGWEKKDRIKWMNWYESLKDIDESQWGNLAQTQFGLHAEKALTAAKKYKEYTNNIIHLENQYGRDIDPVTFYVMHVFQLNEARGIKNVGLGKRIGKPLLAEMKAKHRTVPTIQEMRETLVRYGLSARILDDPAEVYMIRKTASVQAIAQQEYFNKLKARGLLSEFNPYPEAAKGTGRIKTVKTPEGEFDTSGFFHGEKMLKEKDWYATNIGGKAFAGPREVIEDIERFMGNVQSPVMRGMIADGYMKALNLFKANVLIPFPAFHVRNAISDQMRSAWQYIRNVFDPSIQRETWRILTGSDEALSKVMYNIGDGMKISGLQIKEEIQRYGVMSYDLTRWDMDRFSYDMLQHTRNPFKWYYKNMAKGGIYVENHSKVGMYLSNRMRGVDAETAARETFGSLFNYRDRTAFEGKLRAIIPFQKWLVESTKWNLKQLYKTPGKYQGFLRAEESAKELLPMAKGIEPLSPRERESLPQFFQHQLSIPLWREANMASILAGFDFPLDTLNDLGIGKLARSVWKKDIGGVYAALSKALGANLAPQIKGTLELISKKDFFFETPLSGEEYDEETGATSRPFRQPSGLEKSNLPGAGLLRAILGTKEVGGGQYETSPKWRKFLLDVAGAGIPTRYLSTAGKLVEEGPVGQKLLNVFTGAKVYQKNMKDLDIQNTVARIYQTSNLLQRSYKNQKKYQRRAAEGVV